MTYSFPRMGEEIIPTKPMKVFFIPFFQRWAEWLQADYSLMMHDKKTASVT